MAVCEFCEGQYVVWPYLGRFDYECDTVQSYCRVNGQRAVDNITPEFINANFPTVTKGNKVQPSDYNGIKGIIARIITFGWWQDSEGKWWYGGGTLNPDQSKYSGIPQVSQGGYTLLEQYNYILDMLNLTKKSGVNYLSKALMDELKTSIQDYKLSSDRCFTCNTSRNCFEGGGCEGCSDGGGQNCGACCISGNTGPCSGEGCSAMYNDQK